MLVSWLVKFSLLLALKAAALLKKLTKKHFTKNINIEMLSNINGFNLGKLPWISKYHYREMAWLPFQKD